MEKEFTHFNEEGRAFMVDVSNKDQTLRTAKAQAVVKANSETIELIRSGGLKKGDALAVAQVAGIMAAKNTSGIIPMCHPLSLTGVDISFTVHDSEIIVHSTVKCKGETGVEMEALTAVSVAALTIYDMCKAVQKDIVITDIALIKKTGGKSGDYERK